MVDGGPPVLRWWNPVGFLRPARSNSVFFGRISRCGNVPKSTELGPFYCLVSERHGLPLLCEMVPWCRAAGEKAVGGRSARYNLGSGQNGKVGVVLTSGFHTQVNVGWVVLFV